MTSTSSQKSSGEQTLEPEWECFAFYRKTFCDLHYMFLSSTNNGLSASIKISGVIKNLKISADSTFSFWAIEPKRKREINGISRKGAGEEKKTSWAITIYKYIHIHIRDVLRTHSNILYGI